MPEQIYKAIIAFWKNKLKIPIYEQGNVPDALPLPYATFVLDIGTFPIEVQATIFTWHEKNKNLERLTYADKLLKAISNGGDFIQLKDGYITLHNSIGLSKYGDDGAIANRYQYQINFYI